MDKEPSQVSVIIPTINEADTLPRLLQGLADQQDINLEIIVVDGGSTDGTQRIAMTQRARLFETTAGRGHQMNRGATQASHSLLLFLHADSVLTTPHQLARAVAALLAAQQASTDFRIAGHFQLRFRRSRPGHDLAYRFYEEKSALNRK
ncbi:MAG: glycosyltransferase, partial [Gammaproteobacteria bacterium]|nr:glycosyltransferase [Gammaproteobacteria bacterium]